MKKKILIWCITPFTFIWAVYRACQKQCYFISGTGLHAITGQRMFFKICFETHSDMLPLKSIETHCQEAMGLTTCVVISFQKISKMMMHYMQDEKLKVNITVIQEATTL